MNDPVNALVLDLLDWISPGPRPYADVIEAWRTSCPRLPVWETANERGLVEQIHEPGAAAQVVLTARGREALRARRSAAVVA